MFDFPSAPSTGQTYTPTGGPTYVWNGYAWAVLSPGSSYATTIFTATAGQTTFSTTYVVGSIYVYRNGVLLAPADFTATNGTSVVLANGCNAGDTIEIINLAQVPYVNAVQKTGDTMTGTLNLPANGLVVGTTQLVAASGNIGIGTSSPTYQAQVYGVGQSTSALTDAGAKLGTIFINTPTVNAGDGGALLIGASGTNNKPFSAIKGLLSDGANNTTGALAFSTRNATTDTALTERMRIDSSGNVGIGTASYSSRLSIYGSADGNSFAQVSGSNSSASSILGVSSANVGFVGTLSNNDFVFRTNNNEQARITNNGTLGLNTSSPNSNSTLDVRRGSGAGINGNGGQWAGQFIQHTDNAGYGGLCVQSRWGANDTAIFEAATGWNGGAAGYFPVFTVYGKGQVRFGANNAGAIGYIFSDQNDIFQWFANRNGGGSYFYYNTANVYGTASDVRLKEDISAIDQADAEKFIRAIVPSSFRLKDGSDNTLQVGFIAQNILEACPDDATKSAVNNWKTYDPKDPDCPNLGISDRPIIANLVAALQSALDKIDVLEAKVAQLEGAK